MIIIRRNYTEGIYEAKFTADDAVSAAYAARAADAAARKTSLKQSADIVRKHYPVAPFKGTK